MVVFVQFTDTLSAFVLVGNGAGASRDFAALMIPWKFLAKVRMGEWEIDTIMRDRIWCGQVSNVGSGTPCPVVELSWLTKCCDLLGRGC